MACTQLCTGAFAVADCMFACTPLNCKLYSSTNYILLGYILAQHAAVHDWRKLDQVTIITAVVAVLYSDSCEVPLQRQLFIPTILSSTSCGT